MQEHIIPVRQELPFEAQYFRVRNAEQRIYSDEVVRTLPACMPGHPHAAEWLLRSRSAGRLSKYLFKKAAGKVMEIGCGNGWLSNLVATVTSHHVVATDINTFELEQGMRLFKRKNLEFKYSDGSETFPGAGTFDYILFAASIQYFASLTSILNSTLERLSPHGEIHILDTRFYKSSEIPEARERTRVYYQSLGFPLMINNYFHHSREQLQQFRPEFLFDPASFINRLTGATHGFPWIRISKSRQQP